MKTLNLLRPVDALQSVFSGSEANVQEIERVSPVTVAAAKVAGNDARPRVLAQRNARNARRFAH